MSAPTQDRDPSAPADASADTGAVAAASAASPKADAPSRPENDRTRQAQALWLAAARCYIQADQTSAAARCLEHAGRPDEAAPLYEAKRAFHDAARCYHSAGAFADAARVGELAGAWEQAAAWYRRAGLAAEAAWIESHQLGRHIQAERTLAAQFSALPESPTAGANAGSGADASAAVTSGADASAAVTSHELPHALMRKLARARCDAGLGRNRQAARGLIAALGLAEAKPDEIQALPASVRTGLCARAATLAEVLGRPDLGIRSHVALTDPDRDDLGPWRAWSERILGEPTRLPTAPIPPQ